MPFGSSQWMYASGGFYNGVATQSARFDDGSSADLTKTFGSGNQKTWTWSCWVKRSALGGSKMLLSNYTSGTDVAWIYFNSSNQFYFQNYEGGTQLELKTNALYRDVSSWYHVVVALDTTQATASNRAKIYINGEQITSFATSTYPSQNADLKINTNSESHKIGSADSQYYFDGYMAEVNFVDGSQLDPTSFGETKNGVWIPIAYTGSYGTNGFRLEFKQTGVGSGSSSTIGADTSGQDNHFTSSGIVASDCDMPDSPENNFSTLNPLQIGQSNWTLSEGNLKGVSSTSVSGGGGVLSTLGVSNGKWYWECLLQNLNSDSSEIGIANTNSIRTDVTLGRTADSYAYLNNGNKFSNNSSSSYGATYTTGDIIGVALDLDGGTLTFYKNNATQGTAFSSLPSGHYVMGVSEGSTGNQQTQILNFGQDSSFAGNETAQGNTDGNGIGDFYYSPPSGYLALCSANLPEPTISPNADNGTADDYFNTVLWSGNGTSQSVTGVGFQPDWVWIKNRSAGWSHSVNDSVRGVGKNVYTDASDAEVTNNAYGYLSSFGSDGFTVTNGASGANIVNASSNTYVSWNWKAGGTAVSNTDGTITSSVSANTDAGFSIVTYSGSGTAGDTIGHGLNSAPTCIHWKRRNATGNWMAYFEVLGTGGYLNLDRTNGFDTGASPVNGTAPTNSVITLSTLGSINNSAGTYVCYAFHDVEGYSKFGSYTGNGSTDGTFVYTGFRPAWVMLKRTDSANNWHMNDSVRDIDNTVIEYLYADSSAVEDNLSGGGGLDFLSNGFKIRSTTAGVVNASGGTYIYMAFAEVPFKYSTGR